jgi:hypothetical protein
MSRAVSPTPRARLYEKFISDPFSRHKNNAAGEPQTVAVLYEHRASPPDLKRLEVIDAVVESVPRPPHTVKLKGAKKTISVQVIDCHAHSLTALSQVAHRCNTIH